MLTLISYHHFVSSVLVKEMCCPADKDRPWIFQYCTYFAGRKQSLESTLCPSSPSWWQGRWTSTEETCKSCRPVCDSQACDILWLNHFCVSQLALLKHRLVVPVSALQGAVTSYYARGSLFLQLKAKHVCQGGIIKCHQNCRNAWLLGNVISPSHIARKWDKLKLR